MQPLKVTFTMAAPVAVGPHLVHLDGLLGYAVVEQEYDNAEGGDELTQSSLDAAVGKLPLEQEAHPNSPDWRVWKASYLIPDSQSPETRSHLFQTQSVNEPLLVGLFDSGAVLNRKAVIDTARGLLKSSTWTVTTELYRRFTAYCVGDADEIRHLLTNYIDAIGPRRRGGHGRIERIRPPGSAYWDERPAIEVEPYAPAADLWKLRNMPWPLDGYAPIQGRAELPYYKKTLDVVYRPGDDLLWS